ncbi:hypothetical protein F4778DRAFT_776522 [Xylariomycetidae sp. FL2044]|nr:hypothetical protein F4778DRAFT_776522 [Xylariomycetidae sp. FL2044]
MPHPFSPDDFPINQQAKLKPKRVFYLKNIIHFKTDAKIWELTGQVRKPFDDFGHAFLDDVSRAAEKQEQQQQTPPKYEIKSSGNMMRTIKTLTDGATGAKLCDLNITFVSFDSSTVRFPKGDAAHSRHDIELAPVGEGVAARTGHECFVKNSIPYFWDMTARGGRVGVLHKTWNQQRCEIAKVAPVGFANDAVLVLDGDELDDVVALGTCIILLNGRDSMDH